MRWGLAAALLLAGAPLAAQVADVNLSASAPPPAENIGPRELSNFSLNGTVTRPAETPPSTQPPAAEIAAPQAGGTVPASETAVRGQAARPATTAPEPRRLAEPAAGDLLTRPPTLSAPTSTPAAAETAAPMPSETADFSPPPAESGFSPLPWIAALLLVGAGAAFYFGRQRRGQRYAGAALGAPRAYAPSPRPDLAPGPQPERKPPPTSLLRQPISPVLSRAPAPALARTPAPAPAPAPVGVVSTSLRPWLDVEFAPARAVVNDEHAAIAFDVTLINTGSAPARDIAVEARLINVDEDQDRLLGEFYSGPAGDQDRIPLIAPFGRVPLKSVVRLPRVAVHEYVAEGRRLFVPMVAVNALYRWSSGEGQTAVSFLVGRGADGAAKLGPLRVDQGARGWKQLSAKQYERGIRR